VYAQSGDEHHTSCITRSTACDYVLQRKQSGASASNTFGTLLDDDSDLDRVRSQYWDWDSTRQYCDPCDSHVLRVVALNLWAFMG
jgi:hypothetical protein